ncbi:MAG: PIN domain-containing protein [Candidatus Nitrosopelagicus sp.]|nr:PIN domain-containing protein [Candidatus Nitrosopelagicus sp.]
MVFRVLDATAFYAGIPFASNDSFMTTSMVYDEIQHVKAKQDVLEMLKQTNRLQIRDPSEEFISTVRDTAVKTGDSITISKQDISIIALALENNIELITDDFAVTNVAKQLKIKTSSLMTKGISIVGKWISYCSMCGKEFSKQKECSICGSKLNRKLIKKSI